MSRRTLLEDTLKTEDGNYEVLVIEDQPYKHSNLRERIVILIGDSTSVTTREKLDKTRLFSGVVPDPNALSAEDQLEETLEVIQKNTGGNEDEITIQFD